MQVESLPSEPPGKPKRELECSVKALLEMNLGSPVYQQVKRRSELWVSLGSNPISGTYCLCDLVSVDFSV